jgi:hypothetical protein
MKKQSTIYTPLISIRFTIFFLLSVWLNQKLYGQTDLKQYNFSQIGLAIQVPSDFELLKDTQKVKHIEHGKMITNKKRIEELEKNDPKKLIEIQKGQLNTLSIIITPETEDFISDKVKNNFVMSIIRQSTSAPIDTLSSKENIDGITFTKFHASAKANDTITINIIRYSVVYKNYSISIPIFYADNTIGEELNAVIMTAKFDK